MMFLKWCLTCMLTQMFLFGAETLIVELETETPLASILIKPSINPNTTLSKSYLQNLESVLTFDLENSGYFEVSKTPTADPLYTLTFLIDENQLEAKLDSKANQLAARFPKVNLSGDPFQDRRAIHQISNGILKLSFNVDGIALSKILYAVRTKKGGNSSDWTSEIWESDYDGANTHQITQDAGYCIAPLYIPPKQGCLSSAYFYVSYQTGQPKIYYSGLNEASGKRLSLLKGNQLMPAISRKRDQIAFISDITGNPDLFLQPFSPETGPIGKPRQIYTTRQATQGSPSFSPDGKRIAFVSNKDGSPRIYVIDIPKENASLKDIHAKLISKRARESTSPSWSPDGKKIAYSSMVENIRQIVVYDFDTDEETVLTSGPMNKENPAFAANSTHLVFNATANGNSELYLVNIRQKCCVKISSGPGDKRFPNWEIR